MLYVVLKRDDVYDEWLYARCKEVEQNPDGYLDLWAREHYKSTIITFARTIQDLLASHGDDPLPVWNGKEISIGIFSHTRPIAKAFLRQIKYEFETNEILKGMFPDIVWEKPEKQAPKWSEDEGITLRRKSNQKEASVEAWGVVDAQPTSKHFDVLVYDDIVTDKSVTTVEMRRKTTDRLALSYNLGAHGGKRRFIGTRYHFSDTYAHIIERGTAKVRKFPATDDGTVDGKPVFLSAETLSTKRRDMGAYVFGCQMLQDPKAEDTQSFKAEWLRYWTSDPSEGTNRYILVDPASAKGKDSDYTSMWVIGLGRDKNYYILDVLRDRLNLTERGKKLFELHRKWRPLGVGYESYGMQADIEHIKFVQEQENYRFEIKQLGGQLSKLLRIQRLVPLFEQKRIYLPRQHIYINAQGATQDMIKVFVEEEYLPFPVGFHPDMLDSLARITEADLNAKFPSDQYGGQPLKVNTGYVV